MPRNQTRRNAWLKLADATITADDDTARRVGRVLLLACEVADETVANAEQDAEKIRDAARREAAEFVKSVRSHGLRVVNINAKRASEASAEIAELAPLLHVDDAEPDEAAATSGESIGGRVLGLFRGWWGARDASLAPWRPAIAGEADDDFFADLRAARDEEQPLQALGA